MELSFSKLFSRFRNDAGASTLAAPSADLIQALIGFPAAAGKPVTRATAVRVASFLSCVKMLANDVAKMPLILRETTVSNGRQRTLSAVKNPLYPILKDCPNEWQTSFQMRWFLASQLIMNGNSFCQIVRDQKGDVLGLYPLNAWGMSLKWDRTNPEKPFPFWQYDDGTNKRIWQQEEIWHVANTNLEGNGVEGSAIIALAKEALSVIMAAEETAGRHFANGLGIGGFISFPIDSPVDEVQAQNVYDQLKKNFSGSQNAGKFGLIPGGGKFEKMTYTAQESQLLESRRFNSEEIARILGGKPLIVKMGYGSETGTYSSNSAFLDDYFNTCLLPYTVAIEQSITRDLIAKKDRGTLYAKHNPDIILRGSPKERAETNQIKINSWQMTPNEARIVEDMDTIEGGDFLSGPANGAIYDPTEGEFFIPGQKAPEPEDEGTPEPGEAAPPAKPAPKPSARLTVIANSLAERVMRKEAKGGIDAKFIAEVMSISKDAAEAYIAGRSKLNEEEARAALVTLAQGE